MKKILGLDLGTNSIGWALVESNFKSKTGKIIGIGSRIIPMSQEILGEFAKGNSISQTAKRTEFRGKRRLRERHLLRRERLHRTLNILGFLPKHYSNAIDFENRLGQFKPGEEPKLPYHNNTFIFRASFEEMLSEFKKHQPQLLTDENGHNKLVPYDWTLYYLRKKALSRKIDKEELAWIILNFNQKRGYYQLRGEEEEEQNNKLIEFHSFKVIDVKVDEELNNKGEKWYSIFLENGWIYRRASKYPLDDWRGKVRDFIVTTELNDNGSIKKDKEGKEKRSFRAPGENDWTLIKKKTEQEIDLSNKTVGTYIFDTVLQHPQQKIKGKLVRTIERKYYKQELKQILTSQKKYHPELQDEQLYTKTIRDLYKYNDAHQLLLTKKDFLHLLIEDIIFYQRPLRSKKSSINNCSFEFREYTNNNGDQVKEYLKAIPKSNPYYQEFRVWQWMQNLRIFNAEDEKDVTSIFLATIEDKERLFEFLMGKREVDHKDILKFLLKPKGLKGKALDEEIRKYRWNYVYNSEKDESKKYPCNETGYEIQKRLCKVQNIPDKFWKQENVQNLWHIIYSVTDKIEYEKALRTFAQRMDLEINSFISNFINFPPFKSEYGSFSEKAIKKLLPLMRTGKYWNWDNIHSNTQARIQKLITGEYDKDLQDKVRDKAIDLKAESDFQGLQLWLASYIVYGRHSEPESNKKWDSVTGLSRYLKEFKQHSLRNPIVEQVITETLRVVKDIWNQYGNGEKDFFDEIHIELGRELKNTADERKRISNVISENENTNIRIKALLIELMNDSEIENVRPYSPMQQEILKIYEEGVLKSNIAIEEDILKISKKAEPSKSELIRYKLWLEQKYRSPYTGQPIPLSKLFTPEYEIEHIIPQSRFFDDSLSNKVICESVVNKNPYKDNQLALEFIKNQGGTIVTELSKEGKIIKVFTEDEYTKFVKEFFTKNPKKRNKLLLEEVPEKMIERQLNDTRYINKHIGALLSNIVREEQGDEGVNSKNLIPINGKITSQLKRDWGLNDIWNDIIMPRFIRMNKISGSTAFTTYNEKHQKHLPTVPFEYSKGFQKKRIDHRHHALDALIIACTTRNHISLINNEHALDKTKTKAEKQVFRYDLRRELCEKKFNSESSQNYNWVFTKPWQTFTKDAKNELEKTVVSFKQNIRVINKATNQYESYKNPDGSLRIGKNGQPVKALISQKGVNWAIRKPMHKDTVSGKIEISGKKIPKGKTLTASRKTVDPSFSPKSIESITDSGIQKILLNYLKSKDNNTELAFSQEGLEDLNKNIEKYNSGRSHQPIYKVRVYETGSKFALGETGNKNAKFVEAAKGTNLFFAIYENKQGKRNYETIPLNEVIEHQKWRATLPKQEQVTTPMIPIKRDFGTFLFSLSPNDLVYVPTEEEATSKIDYHNLTREQINRIYKMVSCTGKQCFFIKQEVASSIVDKHEYSALNKMERCIEGMMIKDKCIKIEVDRLGHILS